MGLTNIELILYSCFFEEMKEFLMKITRSERRTTVFLLKWADIEKLLGSIDKHLPLISTSVSCSDGLLRCFENIEELKNFNNAQRTSVIRLGIIARNANHSARFSISLSNAESNNVQIELDADELTATAIDKIYQDYLDSLRPWYSPMTQFHVGLVISVVALTVFAGPSILKLLKASLVANELSVKIESEISVLLVFTVLLSLIFNNDLNRLRGRFFPMGTFAFADGEKRHESNEIIRTVVIVAAGLSVLTSIVMSWIL